MKEAQRNFALSAWRQLFVLAGSHIAPEDRYNNLLITADEMERKGLITSLEWRKLAQQAGTLFASTAECMREAK